MRKFFIKYHKWVSLAISLAIVFFVCSGIVLNHRQFFAEIEVPRAALPQAYSYQNWNNASVKSTVKLSPDSILMYGNMGIWLVDSTCSNFRDFNSGFPLGIDNRKIYKVVSSPKALVAGTLFGLYIYNYSIQAWEKKKLPVHEENVVDLIFKGDSLVVMTRSNVLVSKDMQTFTVVKLAEPIGYDHKVSLFKTIWLIHSGEIYGVLGKLIVDVVGIVFLFLMVTGLVMFLKKRKIKSTETDTLRRADIKKEIKWNLKWHNKIGWITGIILIVTTLTGMFLRPPLLIAIGYSKVGKIPYSELDTPNPWYDVLRRMVYIPSEDRFIFSTTNGFYSLDGDFEMSPKPFFIEPPASIMGVNVFEDLGNNTLLVGSFSGLYLWDYHQGRVVDRITMQNVDTTQPHGSPVGESKITGYTKDFGNQMLVFDYERGTRNLEGRMVLPPMPATIIKATPMSLWNLALEVHTGRIFSAVLGMFYILIVPLVGLATLFVLISGIILWMRKFKR